MDAKTGELIRADDELVIPNSALSTMVTAEIAQQVATARTFPRDVDQFIRESKMLVQDNEEMAIECVYSLKRGGKFIDGPSIRFAEIIAANWRNNRSGARVVAEGDEFIVAQGIFQDMETNRAVYLERQRRIVDSQGKRYNIDMIGVTANAAASVALRDAIIHGIPKPYWYPVYLAARQVIQGDARSLSTRRDKCFAILERMGVTRDQLLTYLEVKSEKDIDGEMIVRVVGIIQGIRDGDISAERAFGIARPKARTDVAEKLNQNQSSGERPTTDHGRFEGDMNEAAVLSNLESAVKAAQNLQSLRDTVMEFDATIEAQSDEIKERAAAIISNRQAQFERIIAARKSL